MTHDDPKSLDRRRFLILATGSAAAVGVGALSKPGAASADGPPVVEVLIEELHVGPEQLAGGVLDGVRVSGTTLEMAPGRTTGLYTSPVLRAKDPFTHVGLRWQADLALAIDVSVRWSSDATAWSAWQTVQHEHHGKSASGETFATPIGIGRATMVQVRVAFSQSRGAAHVESLTVTLLNAKDGPARPTGPATLETPAVVAGQVFRREHWGADETQRFEAGTEVWNRMYVPVKKVVVHHTASTNDYNTVEEAKAEMRAVFAYHATALGWGDIGYNVLIDKWGNVYEGRHGRGAGLSREAFTPDVVAGHALHHNYGAVGVALLGTFTKPGENNEPGVPPSDAMQRALIDVLVWQCELHNIDPLDSNDYLLVNDEWNRGLDNIPGHRECNTTICPGGYVYDRLPLIRTAVAQKLRASSPPLRLAAHGGQRGTARTAERVQFDWGSGRGTGRYVYLLEGWRRYPGSEDVEYLTGFEPGVRPAWKKTEARSAGLRELLSTFGNAEAGVTTGRYTFHVAELDDAGRPGYKRTHTLLLASGDDLAPAVEIASPRDGASLPAGAAVQFQAAASDAEDGDLSYRLVWTSSRDGEIGRSAIFTRSLSAGEHVITAAVTDSNGVTRSATVRLRVGT